MEGVPVVLGLSRQHNEQMITLSSVLRSSRDVKAG